MRSAQKFRLKDSYLAAPLAERVLRERLNGPKKRTPPAGRLNNKKIAKYPRFFPPNPPPGIRLRTLFQVKFPLYRSDVTDGAH
jgi:hypothetical protein